MNGRNLIFFSPSPLNTRLSRLEQFADFRRVLHYEPVLDGLTPLIGSGVTFSRATSATYVDADGAVQEAAIDGHRMGLLEPESENLLLDSEDFSSWTNSAATTTTNAIDAPDGNQTADEVVGNGAFDSHGVSKNFSVVSGEWYTISFHVKYNDIQFIQLFFGSLTYFTANDFANFNVSTGQITQEGAVGNASIEALDDGWYRISVSAAAIATGTASAFLRMVTSGTSEKNEDNSTTASVYLWGAQGENRRYATSYKKTTSSTVTRSADSLIISRPDSITAHTDFTALIRFESLFGDGQWNAGSQLRLMGSSTPLIELKGQAGSPDVWRVSSDGFTLGSDQNVDLGSIVANQDDEVLIESDADGDFSVSLFRDGSLLASGSFTWSDIRDESDEFGGTDLFRYQALDPINLKAVIVSTGRMTYEQMRSYRRA